MTGKISFISQYAEYTPPVIYSENARRKLVFMVEARPAEPNARLRTGLPVEFADERHTTQDAAASLSEAGLGGKRSKDVRDRVAAQLILQAWLDDHGR